MGILQSISDEYLIQLSDLLDDVFRNSRGVNDQHIFTDFPLVFAPFNHHNCRVIIEDGKVVSHAALWERELVLEDIRLKVGEIVVVATHPDYRLRGYASSLMRDLQATMQDENYDMGVLWTGVPDFYRKLGWETISPRGWIVEMAGSQLPTADSRSKFETCPYNGTRHLDGIIVLHERERLRFARSRDDFATLLTLPKVNVWVATRNEEVLAYLVCGDAVNKRGIIEYGGDLDGILTLIAHVLKKQPSAANTCILVYHVHPDLIAKFKACGMRMRPLKSSKGDGYEMIYVVNPSRITPRVCEQLFVWGLDYA